jgi:DNA-binding IclR family transcriptional regulator
MAALPQDELDHILQADLEPFTPHTITDPDELREELGRVRQRGFAVAREELEQGLNVVAAPIRDHTGQVVASVSVAGPAYRVTPELFSELAAQLMETAAKISQQLGYTSG